MSIVSRRSFCSSALIYAGAIAASGTEGVGAERSIVISRLYFIPFDTTTFVPVTPRNIEEAATFELSLIGPERDTGPHPFIKSLRAMLRSRAVRTQLNDLAVRLKLVFEGETYYVDAAGGVLESTSTRTFRLQNTELRHIEKSIESFSGVIDMKAFSRAHGDLTPPK